MSGAILAVVPARGGSKGVPRKNLAVVDGHALVARAVMAGRDAGLPVVLSTDDEEIRAEGEKAGAIASFLRPADLATDKAGTVGVLQHAVEWFEKEQGREVVAVVTLQPTSPLRTAEDVSEAVRVFADRKKGCRSLISLSRAGHLNFSILYNLDDEGTASQVQPTVSYSRHDASQLMIRNGAIYISERNMLMEEGSIMCPSPAVYVMPRWRGINIDDHYELYLAQLLGEYPPRGEATKI